MKGKLPWQNIKAKNKQERYEKIMQAKMSISSESLCRDLPSKMIINGLQCLIKTYWLIGEFIVFLNYCKNLKFTDKPDYGYLKRLFKSIAFKMNIDLDKEENDWVINKVRFYLIFWKKFY